MTKKTKILDADEKHTQQLIFGRKVEEYSVDLNEVLEYPPVAISCGTYKENNFEGKLVEYEIPLGTDGNFAFTQAYPKVGKSFFISLLVSAYQGGSNKYTGKIKGNRKKRKIIHFDTEQGKFHVSKLAKRTMVMNNKKEDDNYHIYALRTMDYKERLEFIEYVLYENFDKKNIGLIIVDGVADLCSDVNSMEESNFVVQKLMEWTSVLNCNLHTIIHQNFGTNKATGNLGSALEKKAELQISLEKNSVHQGHINVECKRSRNRGFETFSFTINDNGLPEFVKDDYEFLE